MVKLLTNHTYFLIFYRGQKFHRKYIASVYIGMLMGLLSILAVPSILNVLMCTGKSETPLKAYRRYVKTIYHAVSWFYNDLQPGSKAWESIEMVRKKHLNARKYCEKAKQITIMQRDMAVTQFGFMGYMILRSKMIGIHINDEKELEGPVHFWRVIGYVIGIKDEINLCTGSVAETKERMKIVLECILRPSLEKPIPDFEPMTKALINGLWHFTSELDKDTCIFVGKRLAGCKGYEFWRSDFPQTPTKEDLEQMQYYKLNWFQRFLVCYFISISDFQMRFKIFRAYFNFGIRKREWISYYFPYTAILIFGIKNAYIRIFGSQKKLAHSE